MRIAAVLWCTLVVCVPFALADYLCICTYAVKTTIYSKPDAKSHVTGYLYEFDCKPLIQQMSTDMWFAVMNKRQVAYLYSDSSLQQQVCDGDISTSDLVPGMAPTSTTTTSPTKSAATATTTTLLPITTTPKPTSTSTSTTFTTETMTSTTTLPLTTTTTTTSKTPIPTTTTRTTTIPTTTMSATTTSTATTTHFSTTTSPKPTTTASTTNIPTTMTSTTTIHTPTTTRPTSTTTLTTTTTTRRPTTTRATTTTAAPTTNTTRKVPVTSHAHVTTQAPATTHTHAHATTQPYSSHTTAYTCPTSVIAYADAHNGYTLVHGNTCYEYVTRTNTWGHAEHNCRNKGGHLVYMTSLDDENVVMQFLRDLNKMDEVWIGLSDRHQEQRFEWSSGAVFNYSKWKIHHFSHNHHADEDCVVLVPLLANDDDDTESIGQWDDVTCDERHHWVCRYDGPSHTSIGSGGNGGSGFIIGRRQQKLAGTK